MSPGEVFTVTLALHEIKLAADNGVFRRLETLRQGIADKHGYDQDGKPPWESDIQAAAAEIALAKLLNRYWDGSVNTFHRGDVGHAQVRSTDKPHGRLIVRPDDPNDEYFILAVGKIPTFEIHGYILGADAKQDRWLDAPNGRPSAYFVPREALTRFRRKRASAA